MLRRFRLEEPENIQAASVLLAQYGESAKVYAGGTELLLTMKEGLVHYECLINIKQISGLDQNTYHDGVVHIGALATHNQLAHSAIVRKYLPSLAEMENNIANIRVREAGTIGGNLCFAEPHADPGTFLLVLGAKLLVEKSSTSRVIPAEKFFVDAYETCLEPDEILKEIQVPLLPQNTGLTYMKFGYLERPSVGVAFLLILSHGGKSVAEARIAVGCVGPKPKRIEEAEELLMAKGVDDAAALIAKAGQVAGRASEAISDLHGSQDYKEHIVQVLLKRAFNHAREQCRPKTVN